MSQSPERIVYLGDSHSVQLFGRSLSADLRASALPGAQHLKRYAVGGSAAIHWNDRTFMHPLDTAYYCEGLGNVARRLVPATFPLLNQLVAGVPPKAVVIALGTNDIGWDCKLTGEEQTAQVRTLLAKLPPSTACVWVGPVRYTRGPLKRKCTQGRIDSFIDHLESEVRKRCTYLDSRVLRVPNDLSVAPQSRAECTENGGHPLAPNAGDDLHFSGSLAKYWADCVSLGVIEALTADPKFNPVQPTN